MRIKTLGLYGASLALVACGGGSSGGGSSSIDPVDTSTATTVENMSPSEMETAEQALEAQERGMDAIAQAGSAVALATPTLSAITKQLDLPGLAASQATESIDYTIDAVEVDTDFDGTNDARVSGSGEGVVTVSDDGNSGTTDFEYEVSVDYIADATFTEGSNSYTVKSGSGVDVEMNIDMDFTSDGDSSFSFTADYGYELEFDSYTVAWTEDGESGTTSLSGTIAMTANDITLDGTDGATSASLSGTIDILLTGTVTIGDTSHSYTLDGEGSYGFNGSTYTSEATYYISVDGTTYGPFTESEIGELPASAQ